MKRCNRQRQQSVKPSQDTTSVKERKLAEITVEQTTQENQEISGVKLELFPQEDCRCSHNPQEHS